MATVADVITAALQDLGVIQAGETPSSEDQAYCFSRLNRLLDSLAGERLFIYTITRSTWTIVSGDGSYTVGTGGDVNIARPVFVEHVYFQDTTFSPVLEMPLQPLTDDAYAKIPQKTLTSNYPTCWYYNPTFPLATLTFWPVPTSSTIQGVIYAATAVAQFSATTDSVTLPPGYKRMLETNLALEICPGFEKQPSPALVRLATDSKASVLRENTRLMDLNIDSGALGQAGELRRWWNIYVGP